MARKLRIHDGAREAADFERLATALDRVVAGEAKRLEAGEGERDLDRGRIRAAFDGCGFFEEYFDLDFRAPLGEFLAALCHLREDLPMYVDLHELYPDGLVDIGDLVSAEPAEDFGPED